MPYGRSRMSPKKGIINSVKAVVDGVFLAVAAGVVTNVNLGLTVDTFVGTAGTFPIGAKIFGIYLFVNIQPDAAVGNVDYYVSKTSPILLATMPIPGSTGGDASRRFILHEEKGLPVNRDVGGVPSQFKGVIVIPKGRQRMGDGDVIRLHLRCSSAYSACVKCIYKWYI